MPPLLRVLVSAVPLLPHDRPLGLPTLARGARSFVLGGSGGQAGPRTTKKCIECNLSIFVAFPPASEAILGVYKTYYELSLVCNKFLS